MSINAGTSILEGILQTVSPATDVVYYRKPRKENIENKNFDYAIVVVGEKPYAETGGDNLNLTIPLHGTHTIKNTCRYVKCLVVLISGRPLVIKPYLHKMDGLVAAWLPGTEGQGVADVIFGDYEFTGRLSRTWFQSVDQLPMNVGDEDYDPLFPFGFGLTMGLDKNRYYYLALWSLGDFWTWTPSDLCLNECPSSSSSKFLIEI